MVFEYCSSPFREDRLGRRCRMLTVEEYGQIRRAYREGMGIRAMARGVSSLAVQDSGGLRHTAVRALGNRRTPEPPRGSGFPDLGKARAFVRYPAERQPGARASEPGLQLRNARMMVMAAIERNSRTQNRHCMDSVRLQMDAGRCPPPSSRGLEGGRAEHNAIRYSTMISTVSVTPNPSPAPWSFKVTTSEENPSWSVSYDSDFK